MLSYRRLEPEDKGRSGKSEECLEHYRGDSDRDVVPDKDSGWRPKTQT